MDFVDLDKVLDEFEEEEKAAGSITPGQEVKPSGYAQFVESHQDKPWESMSEAPANLPVVPPSYTETTKNNIGLMYDYDVPYDPNGFSSKDFMEANRVAALKQLENFKRGVDYSVTHTDFTVENITNNISHQKNSLYANEIDGSSGTGSKTIYIDPVLLTGKSQQHIDDYSQDDQNFKSNVSTYSLSEDVCSNRVGKDLTHSHHNGNLSPDMVSSRSRSIKASQVTAVQTDALTPHTEKELMSQPFPKSDIIVDGHGTQQENNIFDVSSNINATSTSAPSSYAHNQRLQVENFNYARNENTIIDKSQSNLQTNTHSESTKCMVTCDNSKMSSVTGESQILPETVESLANDSGPQCERDVHSEVEDITNSTDIAKNPENVASFSNFSVDVDENDVDEYLRESEEVNEMETVTKDRTVNIEQTANFEQRQDGGLQNPDIVLDVGRSEATRTVTDSFVQYAEAGGQRNSLPSDHQAHFDESEQPEPPSLESDFAQSRTLEIEKIMSEVDFSDHSNSTVISSVEAEHGPVQPNSSAPSAITTQNQITSGVSKSTENMVAIGSPPHDSQNNTSKESFISESARDISTCSPVTSGSSQTDHGSPRMMTGVGARPKDRKNRPNSLLGLSKVNLDSPFNIVQQVPEKAENLLLQAGHSEDTMVTGSESEMDRQWIHQSGLSPQEKKKINMEIKQQIQQEEKQRMENEGQDGRFSGMSGSSHEQPGGEPISDGDPEDDTPVMRRSEEQMTNLDMPRPHSWSPGGSGLHAPQKLKRPTSLNLPPRGDFSLQGDRSPDNATGRFRGMGQLPESDIPEETEASGGDEMMEGEEIMEPTDTSDSDSLPYLSGENQPQSIIHTHLGRVAPKWIPDGEAANCMQCQSKFTFTKRRHHCRACGKVFCSTCCSLKSRLVYMESKEARVCQSCHQLLQTGSQRRAEPKQVMFSDGIRPGGDLTELDGSAEARLPPRRTGRVQKKVEKTPGGQSSPKTRRLRGGESVKSHCLIPPEGLPPLYIPSDKGEFHMEENPDPKKFMPQIKDEETDPVIFAINYNLFVMVKILFLDCCVNRQCWCFTTKGMCTVGQNEIVIVLEMQPDEESPPRDIFCHFSSVYGEAGKGNTVSDMGHSIFNQSFLGSRDHGGFLYLRPTFQCLQKIILPNPPYVFGILLQKWETPWAKVFPIRLLLRLGAEHRYYPCPLVSIRNRKPVFFEIGHTIMNLLADFRNYQYMLPQIKGVYTHMEDKKTIINFPKNRFDDLMKVVNNSNEHVMALGSNFSAEADSHLVCIQNDEGNYQTQAINIQNKPRKVTGASFVVFNGALKASSGLRAKSSIVEDGLMVQILPDCMTAVKQAIKDMKDFTIGCGSVTIEKPEEIVMIQWVEEDKNVNIGVKSPVDKMALDGIESIHIHNSTDYVGEHRSIRWTEVFFIQNEDTGSKWEPVDLSRLAETLASATCIALTCHLDRLKEASMTRIGLRVTIDTERVGYEIGANGEKMPDFYMNDLDSALIPVIHNAASQNQEGPIVLELIFYVVE